MLKCVLICSSLLFHICLCSMFLSRESVFKITTKLCILIFLLFNTFQIAFTWLCSFLVSISGDVEVNPGSKNKGKICLSVCHWSLNNISLYDYSKLFLLNSNNSLHEFDIICFSKTYLDSNTPLDDHNLEISGYTLACSDHPSNYQTRSCLSLLPKQFSYKSYKYWLLKWMSNPWTQGSC